MVAAVTDWLTGIGGLGVAAAALLTVVLRYRPKRRNNPKSGMVSVDAAVAAFNSLIAAQDGYQRNLLERVERLEVHVQACEDEKIALREALAEARLNR